MTTYIDILPYEIQEKIYRNVFQDCMTELRENYKNWRWRFDAKFTCCDNITYSDFRDGCLKTIYLILFLLSANIVINQCVKNVG